MNLDKTLREKFNNWALNRMIEHSLPNWNECSDWWLAEFHQVMNEKREACCPACKMLLQLKDED